MKNMTATTEAAMSEGAKVTYLKGLIAYARRRDESAADWCNRKGWHAVYIGTIVCIHCGTEPWGRPIRHIPAPAEAHGQA